jgi:hypothetical protein
MGSQDSPSAEECHCHHGILSVGEFLAYLSYPTGVSLIMYASLHQLELIITEDMFD